MADLGAFERPVHDFTPLRAVAGGGLVPAALQSGGMTRYEAISGQSVAAQRLWMGRVLAPAGLVSEAHHHGESESAIYVVSGGVTFFSGPDLAMRLDVEAGDFVYVPAWAVHVEANLTTEDSVLVVARSTQEAIVVNVAGLRPSSESLAAQSPGRGIDVY